MSFAWWLVTWFAVGVACALLDLSFWRSFVIGFAATFCLDRAINGRQEG